MFNKTTKFTGTVVASLPHDARPCTLIVNPGSGTVRVDVLIDTASDQWVTHATYDIDGVHKLDANGCTVRIVCSGSAAAAFVRI